MEFSQWWWLAAAVTVGIGLLSSTFLIGKWVGKINQRVDSVTENLKSTSTALISFTEEVREDMRHIRVDINRIFERLSPTSNSHSPRQLTDLGEKVSEDLQAKQWAQRTAATVQNQVAGKPAYDVQEFCFDYVRQFNPGAKLDMHINDCAYNYGIDRYAVLDVLAIELRNALLTEAANSPTHSSPQP